MNLKLTTDELEKQLDILNQSDENNWIISDGKLTKNFSFKNFTKAFSFMSACVDVIKKQKHHPEWSNVYNKVVVQLVTHDVGGISMKDFTLAYEMDNLAKIQAVSC
ncbi:putative pterin-4-alpha-carbinolamine dehydratase [Xenorhabdus vietnamensis]|uniref:Putative pterin-4-alpha-carbinolamine dehydratase n=1 Tax=Xenorhabdus vietnamensis TaxID=351656 RepID=A0A1Y2SKT9_9GAMM|nr:4a-hydroxytetrahydrobiopterin dehydratase [Xenorhabdus vietnamensis]OTA18203.1 putative pterin-4-alpha-carbinolamine dehydratase [Xenorhabdus vietnamensis]